MKKLIDLPNVGPVLEDNLIKAGIKSPEELIKCGGIETFKKIRKIDPGACIHMLYGIEGAIQNIKDSNLSKETKEELKLLYNNLDK